MDGSSPGGEPVLPMFVQMNARMVEEDDQWREVSRWVKFQENVEDGGKRWSKPFVPARWVFYTLNIVRVNFVVFIVHLLYSLNFEIF